MTDSVLRRTFLKASGLGLGQIALATLLNGEGEVVAAERLDHSGGLLNGLPHFAARARNVIFLCMAGGPSHLETFDYKPELQRRHGQTANLEQRRRSIRHRRATSGLRPGRGAGDVGRAREGRVPPRRGPHPTARPTVGRMPTARRPRSRPGRSDRSGSSSRASRHRWQRSSTRCR